MTLHHDTTESIALLRADAEQNGLYNSTNEHDACGVGFVAHIKGQRSHAIVQQGLLILHNLDHRGAVDSQLLRQCGLADALMNTDQGQHRHFCG